MGNRRRVAFGVYCDPRKRHRSLRQAPASLQLGMFASPDYTYHDESPEGATIIRLAAMRSESGRVAGLSEWQGFKVADVKERNGELFRVEPARVETSWSSWNTTVGTTVGESSILLENSPNGGCERGFTHAILRKYEDDFKS